MRKKRHTPEEIVSKLRQVDVLVAQGTPVADAVLPKRLWGLMKPLRCRITAKVAVKDGAVPFGCTVQAYGSVPHRVGCAPSKEPS